MGLTVEACPISGSSRTRCSLPSTSYQSRNHRQSREMENGKWKSTCRPEQAAQWIHHFGKTCSPRSSGMRRIRLVRVCRRNAGTARRGERQSNGCRQAPLVPAYRFKFSSKRRSTANRRRAFSTPNTIYPLFVFIRGSKTQTPWTVTETFQFSILNFQFSTINRPATA